MKPIQYKSTLDMSREDWLAERKTFLGGSDCATIMGMSPFCGKLTLWMDKQGMLPDREETDALRTGRDLEEYVASRFCEATGKKVRKRNYIFKHSDFPFIGADIDREVIGENAGLECKTTSAYNKHDFENGDIPVWYLCQCWHYMAVMGYDKMYLAVLVGGQKFYWFTVDANNETQDKIIETEVLWWQRHMLGGVEPDAEVQDEEAVNLLHPSRDDDRKCLLYSVDNLLAEYEAAMKVASEADAKKKQLKNLIVQAMQGCHYGETDDYKVSNAPHVTKTVDKEKLMLNYPDVYAKVIKETTSTTFRLSLNKEKQ